MKWLGASELAGMECNPIGKERVVRDGAYIERAPQIDRVLWGC